MHHSSIRPTPLAYGTAGGVCVTGAGAVIVRAVDTFTAVDLPYPIVVLSFAVALACTTGGPALVAWLMIRAGRTRVALLETEIRQLRGEVTATTEILDAVRSADAQAEVNTVLLRRLVKTVEARAAIDADTEPIGRLHSITGGGRG